MRGMAVALAVSLAAGHAAAKNCTTGCACGNTCISCSEECHKDDGEVSSTGLLIFLGIGAFAGLMVYALRSRHDEKMHAVAEETGFDFTEPAFLEDDGTGGAGGAGAAGGAGGAPGYESEPSGDGTTEDAPADGMLDVGGWFFDGLGGLSVFGTW